MYKLRLLVWWEAGYRLWRHRKLVDLANQWLRRRRHHGDGDVTTTVKTCETMTWMSRDVSQLTDSESMVTSKSVVDGADTYYLRGLRLCVFFYIITDHSCLEVPSIPAETCHVCQQGQSQLSLFSTCKTDQALLENNNNNNSIQIIVQLSPLSRDVCSWGRYRHVTISVCF